MNFKEVNPIIIGMCGAKQVGKGTIATLLSQQLSHIVFVENAFAHQIKLDVASAFGISLEELEKRKNDPIVRKTLQYYGTEWSKGERGEAVWINVLEARLFPCPWTKRVISYITDCRFKDEAEWIRSKGGSIVTIERPSIKEAADPHRSEREWIQISPDWRIINDGSMLDLERNVKWLARDIKERYGI